MAEGREHDSHPRKGTVGLANRYGPRPFYLPFGWFCINSTQNYGTSSPHFLAYGFNHSAHGRCIPITLDS